ncbi:hypothetical protein JW905_04165 [bacterium]|nr:hypothetical protein [candidate division CSSED10-310 bacterium]
MKINEFTAPSRAGVVSCCWIHPPAADESAIRTDGFSPRRAREPFGGKVRHLNIEDQKD